MPEATTWPVTDLREADIPAAIALWRSCDGVGLGQADGPERLGRFLQANPGLSLAVKGCGGELLAAVLVGTDTRRGYLYHLAVRADARRKGIGRVLAAEAMRRLGQAGMDRCNICVFADNAEALSFWQSAGFVLRENLVLMSCATAR
jgi:ribosomal protein S18 acetylase RimI-like enzyme